MRMEFDEDERALREAAREFAEQELDPLLASYPEAPLPKQAVLDLFKLIQPFGILSARIPRDFGGDELTSVQLGILYEMFPAEVAMDASTNDLTAFRIYHGGSAELRERYLARIARGEIIAGSSISEPGAGSDLTSIATRAVRDGDEYVINGTKLWSSQAAVADILMVAVSLGRDERGRSILGRVLVETGPSSIDIREIEMMGLRRHNMSEIFFTDTRVPAGNMIGDSSDAMATLSRSWLSQRANLALISVHLAQQALDASIAHAKTRTQFGRAIGGFQLIQSMLVEMSTLVDTSRYLSYRALHLIDAGRPSRYATSVAKYYATEAAVTVTNMAMQIHGALGLSREHGLEKLNRDARMLTIPDGTTQINKLIAGRELLGINAIRG
jgi:alkylation response protein AidB-like acyl-CoA dehydrogenase